MRRSILVLQSVRSEKLLRPSPMVRNLPLQYPLDECKQFLCGRITGGTEIVVELRVIGLFRTEKFSLNPRVLQYRSQPLGLSTGVRVVGDIENQKWWDAFIFRDMRYS